MPCIGIFQQQKEHSSCSCIHIFGNITDEDRFLSPKHHKASFPKKRPCGSYGSFSFYQCPLVPDCLLKTRTSYSRSSSHYQIIESSSRRDLKGVFRRDWGLYGQTFIRFIACKLFL